MSTAVIMNTMVMQLLLQTYNAEILGGLHFATPTWRPTLCHTSNAHPCFKHARYITHTHCMVSSGLVSANISRVQDRLFMADAIEDA